MIKRIILGSIIPLIFIFQSSSVLAFQVLKVPCTESSGASKSSVCSPSTNPNPLFGKGSIMDDVINLISVIVGIVAVFAIIVAGFMFITSGGDSAKINTAKNTIIYVVIGIAVVALAQALEIFVINHIGSST